MGPVGAVLTHLSLAGGLDLERLLQRPERPGGTQWVVAPGQLAVHCKGQPTPTHPPSPPPQKARLALGCSRGEPPRTSPHPSPLPQSGVLYPLSHQKKRSSQASIRVVIPTQ